MQASHAAWRWLPLAAVAGVAVAWRGGYAADARGAVTILAGLAALAALWAAPEATARASRDPIVVTLAILAVATALSATWTVGAAATALRDGAAVLALAAVVVAAAALPAPWGHGGLLVAAALGCALSGLAATLGADAPRALEICGTWRPAGPFEYPPTLALVCASGLPVALAAGSSHRRTVAAAGVLAAWLLATTIALTANRTGIAFGALAVLACVALGPPERALGPVGLGVLAAAVASALLVGGDLARAGTGVLVLALVPGLLAAISLPHVRRGGRSRGRWIALVAAAAIGSTAAGFLAEPSGCGGEVSHGRIGIWRAAVSTAAQRPLLGYGAGSFLVASRGRQLRERPVPTRYAHDLPLESWVELGIGGLLAACAWYLAVLGGILARVRLEHAWVLVPAVAAFPLANLLDWPWELTGAGVLWAIAAGGLIALGAVVSSSHVHAADRLHPPSGGPGAM